MARRDFSYNDGMHNHEVSVRKRDKKFTITIDGFPYLVENVKHLSDGQIEFTLDGKSYRCVVSDEGDQRYVFMDGHAYELKRTEDIAIAGSSTEASTDKIIAIMPGVVVSILVKEGDKITKGQKIIVLEAMKMQNTIVAPLAGVISKILVKEGDQVKDGDLLVDIEPEEDKNE